MSFSATSFHEVIIIGAGPAGLFLAGALSDINPELKPLVLERASQGEIGSSWNNVWDNFKLAMPVSELTFPGFSLEHFQPKHFMTKTEIISTLKAYTALKKIHILFNQNVSQIHQDKDYYRVEMSGDQSYCAKRVVLCTGPRSIPKFPHYFAAIPSSQILHSTHYKSFESLGSPTRVLIIGSGLSARQIALDLKQSGCPDVSLSSKLSEEAFKQINMHLSPTHLPSDATLITEKIILKKAITALTNGYFIYEDGKFEPVHAYQRIICATGYHFQLPPMMGSHTQGAFLFHHQGETRLPGIYIMGIPSSGSTKRTVTLTEAAMEAQALATKIVREMAKAAQAKISCKL